MRTLNANLTTAQQSAIATPFIRLTIGASVYKTTDVTNRIVKVEQWEELYDGETIITLNNYDGALTDVNFQGKKVYVGWGYYSGSELYSNAASMKVLSQQDDVSAGIQVVILHCIGVWTELKASGMIAAGRKLVGVPELGMPLLGVGNSVSGDPSGATGTIAIKGSNWIVIINESVTEFASGDDILLGSDIVLSDIATPSDNNGPPVYNGDTSVTNIIKAIFGAIVSDVVVDEDDPDSNMASTPYLRIEFGSDSQQIVYQRLNKTKCGARYCNDDKLHALYLDLSDAAQYTFNGTHATYSGLRERALTIPNRITVVDRLPTSDGIAPNYIGSYYDYDSHDKLGVYYDEVVVDPDVTSNSVATNRAACIIFQRIAQAYQGVISAPMECGLEIHDMVSMTYIPTVTVKGRIGRINRIFDSSTGEYSIKIGLGGLMSSGTLNDSMASSAEADKKVRFLDASQVVYSV